MTELLSAGLFRLRRSKVLWIALAALVLFTAGRLLWQWNSHKEYGASPEIARELELENGYMEDTLFTTAAWAVLLSSALCAWELGAEYQDGAQRNKLAVGHKRRNVYLASLLLTVLTCAALCLAVFLPGSLVILLTVGDFTVGWGPALLRMAGMTAAAAAFASLFTLLGVNIPHRAAAAIVTIGLTLALVLGGEMLANRLAQKPFFNTYEVTADGELIPTPRPNPRYIPEGPLKDALTFLSDLNPGGQLDRYTRDSAAPDPPRLMAHAALFFVLTSAAGVLIFRRKDLR